ncbi:hypothetical protein NL108_008581 [Boleophthalmus pectinirostris]|nr:hypothetical protein NL108_008581 [Boleophthalmus pectinirostris]
MDLQHKELNNVPTTEEDGDTESKNFDEEVFEDAPEKQEPQSPISAPQVHQDIKSTPLEQESHVQTDPQSVEHHTESATDTGPNESTETPEETGKGNDTGGATSPPTSPTSSVSTPAPDSSNNDTSSVSSVLPHLPHQSSTPPVGQDEPGSTKQTNPDAHSDTDQVTMGPLIDDPSNCEKQFNVSQISTLSPVSASQPQSSQPESAESEDKKKSDEESHTTGLEKKAQGDPEQDDKGNRRNITSSKRTISRNQCSSKARQGPNSRVQWCREQRS